MFWGIHLRCFYAKPRSMDESVLSRLFHIKTTQSTTAITSIEILRITESIEKNKKFAESKQDSSLRVSEASVAIQKKLNPCETPKSRPLRGAKNREQGCSSATADFLLEAEKRGTPPKSEKAAAFWEHNLNEVGGSGSGVQPFLRKEISESNAENSENIADSANNILFCHIERSEISQKNRDFSPTAQNDNFVDCHDLELPNLTITESSALDSVNQIKIAESSEKSTKFAESRA
ncbi:hypothetical protein [Helicobacter sp. 23-1045]